MRRGSSWIMILACAMLYFVVGKFGYEPRLAAGPISLNQILQVGTLAALCSIPWTGEIRAMSRSRVLWLVGIFACMLAVRAIGSENGSYSTSKPLGYAAIIIPTLALLAAILRDDTDVRRFLTAWAVIGSGMMLFGLCLTAFGQAPPRLAVFGGGANVFARMLGSALLVWIGLGTRTPRGTRVWPWLLPGFALALLLAGSKSVIIGIAFSLVLLGWHLRDRRLALGSLAGLLLFGTAPLWAHEFLQHADKDRGEIRMFRLPDIEDPRGSYGARLKYYQESMSLLGREGLIGVGTGDWTVALGHPSGRRYPHNILLEVGCELGVFGVTVLGVALLWVVRWFRSLRKTAADHRLVGTLLIFLVFWFWNALWSGDVVDNRSCWLALLLLEIVHHGYQHHASAGHALESRDRLPL